MRFYSIQSVQRGSELSTVDSVKKRLAEIATKKSSAYHGAYHEGRIHVLKHGSRRHRGKYDIVVLEEIAPEGMSECSECNAMYLALNDDYLCPQCRSSL